MSVEPYKNKMERLISQVSPSATRAVMTTSSPSPVVPTADPEWKEERLKKAANDIEPFLRKLEGLPLWREEDLVPPIIRW